MTSAVRSMEQAIALPNDTAASAITAPAIDSSRAYSAEVAPRASAAIRRNIAIAPTRSHTRQPWAAPLAQAAVVSAPLVTDEHRYIRREPFSKLPKVSGVGLGLQCPPSTRSRHHRLASVFDPLLGLGATFHCRFSQSSQRRLGSHFSLRTKVPAATEVDAGR